jgi:hypothetical protein
VSYYDEISSAIPERPILTRNELFDYFKAKKPSLADNSCGWLLYKLCQECVLKRVSYNAYSLYTDESTLKRYEADVSSEAATILEFSIKRFPEITVIAWETRAFNEFLNHQLARNIIFVEVEKPYCEFVFEALHENGDYNVLYKPSEKEITMYASDITVSVLPLTSEAPINGNNAKLEKLLVDLFANALLDKVISKGDFLGIYKEAVSKYDINYNVMLRYAKRRGKGTELQSIMESGAFKLIAGRIFI